MFIRRTNAEAPLLWSHDMKSQLIGKDTDAGKNWRQDKGAATEDETVEQNYQLHGHELEQTPVDSEGQGSLVCSSPRGQKESDMTQGLNNNNKLT